jgi:hypothetical protein
LMGEKSQLARSASQVGKRGDDAVMKAPTISIEPASPVATGPSTFNALRESLGGGSSGPTNGASALEPPGAISGPAISLPPPPAHWLLGSTPGDPLSAMNAMLGQGRGNAGPPRAAISPLEALQAAMARPGAGRAHVTAADATADAAANVTRGAASLSPSSQGAELPAQAMPLPPPPPTLGALEALTGALAAPKPIVARPADGRARAALDAAAAVVQPPEEARRPPPDLESSFMKLVRAADATSWSQPQLDDGNSVGSRDARPASPAVLARLREVAASSGASSRRASPLTVNGLAAAEESSLHLFLDSRSRMQAPQLPGDTLLAARSPVKDSKAEDEPERFV